MIPASVSHDSACLVDTETIVESLALIHIIASTEHPSPYGTRWLTAASGHLTAQLDAYFRERPPFPTTEQAALAMVQDIARELQAAASALDTAAATLKNQQGCGLDANRARQAAVHAREVAQGLVPA